MQMKQRYWYVFPLVFVLVGVVAGGWIWNHFSVISTSTTNQSRTAGKSTGSTHSTSTSAATATAQTQSFLDLTSGAHLLIPEINLNAPVELVGVTPQGKLNTPQTHQWTDVGWYQKGPVPGQQGSAVIDGHLDRPGGTPAVFWNLHKLHPGDIVMVTDAHHHVLQFRVLKMDYYTPQNAPLQQIFANTSGTYLNLITCAGTWVPAIQETTQRLVVYTTLISPNA